jgi:hypothetical protein
MEINRMENAFYCCGNICLCICGSSLLLRDIRTVWMEARKSKVENLWVSCFRYRGLALTTAGNHSRKNIFWKMYCVEKVSNMKYACEIFLSSTALKRSIDHWPQMNLWAFRFNRELFTVLEIIIHFRSNIFPCINEIHHNKKLFYEEKKLLRQRYHSMNIPAYSTRFMHQKLMGKK